MRPLRLIQVGLGPHGRAWARRVIPDITEVELVAFVDSDPYSLDAVRKELNVPTGRCFESLKEAVVATQPQAVLNTTALAGHVPVTRAALDLGLHVLVEKPFAPNLSSAQELVDVAAANRLVLMVSQNYRFFPAPRAVASLVHDAGLGRLHEVAIDFRRYSPAGPTGRDRHHLEEQPLLVDMSIHHFDLLRMILNREPERIYCETWNPEWSGFSGPPVAVASIVFDGVVASYRGSWISAGPVTPWAGDWRMEFERGEVVWTSAADSDMTQDKVEIRPRQGEAYAATLPIVPRPGTWGTLTEFASAIQAGRQPESSGRDNLGSIALMTAAVESATRRASVVISGTAEAMAI